MRRLIVALCLVLGVVPATSTAPFAPPAAAAAFTASGSVNQVYALDLVPGSDVELRDGAAALVQRGVADVSGTYLFRKVTAGSGYQVASGGSIVGGLTVTGPDDHPSDAWYQAQADGSPIGAGFGYLTTRDGTKLSVNVTFPFGEATGPWPVVINYSGYDPSKPGLPPRESLLYAAQGYVVVGVNMRGTGCSGGAFEFMETLQSTDGYDMVETLAHQPWANGNVGLVGISYSGYSQLYVAATQPPHLRAITPLSPFSDTYSAILYPGGILNDGFAVGWATARQDGARPRASGWVKDRIDDDGDATCARNQLLRTQSLPLLDRIHSTPFAEHEFDYLNTETFVDQIQVPTYLASQWQDEQTGGSAANLVNLFDPATKVYASFTNGAHVEPMATTELFETMAFVDLYVGHRIPHVSDLVAGVAPGVLAGIFGSDDAAAFAIPPNPWAQYLSYRAALAAYEAQPPIRIRWENGTVAGKEGLPLSPTLTRHANWPLDGLINEKLYLQPDGALGAAAPAISDTAARAASTYTYDPTTKRNQTFSGSTEAMWEPHPDVHWDPLTEGNSLSFVTPAYSSTVAYAGQGSADLWVRSSAADTDFEVTLTEVRPDGQEVYIQSGWLRASHRKLDPTRSTELVPFQTHQAGDAAPLPSGSFTKVRIEMFPFAHVIRPGSRLRVNIEAPGGNQPFWAFETLSGTATNQVGHSAGMPSRIVLPRVPAAQAPAVPTALPPCVLPGVTTQSVSLRNQPCRPYRPARVATSVTAARVGPALRVVWTAPGGPAPTSYRVVPSAAVSARPGAAVPASITVPGDQQSVSFTGFDKSVDLEFRVIAVYGSVAAPASDASLPTSRPVIVQPTEPTDPTDPNPPAEPGVPGGFASTEAFVRRQLIDFTGSASTDAVRAGVQSIRAGTAAGWTASLRDGSDATGHVDPVARLYLAYFGRLPEPGGLDFWTSRHRGGLPLNDISAFFAGSPEFRHTYGALTNREFVDLVYQNVLGRQSEPGGIDYWTTVLDTRVRNRGEVMVGFSESPEFVRTSAARIDVAHIWIAMLDRRPTEVEVKAAVNRLTTGTPLATLISEILASVEYRSRVDG